MKDEQTSPRTTDLPPGFRLFRPGEHIAGDGFVLVNGRSLTEHSSRWQSAAEARAAAWDWWHDVKEKSDA